MLGDDIILNDGTMAVVISESTGNRVAITKDGKLHLKYTDGKEKLLYEFNLNMAAEVNEEDLVKTINIPKTLTEEEKQAGTERNKAVKRLVRETNKRATE